jgi:hypothetical protein
VNVVRAEMNVIVLCLSSDLCNVVFSDIISILFHYIPKYKIDESLYHIAHLR